MEGSAAAAEGCSLTTLVSSRAGVSVTNVCGGEFPIARSDRGGEFFSLFVSKVFVEFRIWVCPRFSKIDNDVSNVTRGQSFEFLRLLVPVNQRFVSKIDNCL